MGDSAKDKRREQLKRWSGSCTDKEPAVPRRRWRGNVEDGGDSEAVNNDQQRDQSRDGDGNGTTQGEILDHGTGPLLKRRLGRVRFDRAAEFLAACASGDTDEAREMLKEARETTGKDGEDLTAIIDCSNADGITALHQACIDGSMEMVAFLLAQGANVDQVDSEGWTPLHVAASGEHIEITDFLLQRGASLSAVNCDGDVPLDIAVDEATESLLQEHTRRQGVDLEAAKRLEEEQIMLDARAWLTEGLPRDTHHPRTGATPLHVAAAKGYLEAIKLLCQCGLDVSAVDCDGWTPLHAAAHWGQAEACCILAEQLCNMEAHSNGGQTPFDVADESVEALLTELSQKQASWRSERSLLERQNPAGSNTANAQNKRRRSSVCRMSSKDKIIVQDQSKERGVSGGLELSEERESSPESSPMPSPDSESVTESTVSPGDRSMEDKDDDEDDKANRTARVAPTSQWRDGSADSPTTLGADRRKFQAPVRDEESESQRKARSRLMRQSRRSTQGVTLTDLKEAEKSAGKAPDAPPPPARSILPVSPIVTLTPAERDTDPVREVEGESRLAVRDKRRTRRERRSTGIGRLGQEDEDDDATITSRTDDAHSNSTASDPQPDNSSLDYKLLYREVVRDNVTLKEKLQETELLLSQNKVELERLRQSQESSMVRPALLELERFEKLALQRKAVELEDELKVLVDLRADNQRLKDENAALIRVISKLSK
ncbi:unnamed protein product [Lota lota]